MYVCMFVCFLFVCLFIYLFVISQYYSSFHSIAQYLQLLVLCCDSNKMAKKTEYFACLFVCVFIYLFFMSQYYSSFHSIAMLQYLQLIVLCCDGNKMTNNTEYFVFSIEAKPDPPALYVTKITSNSVLLYWSIPSDGGSKLIAFVVQYKITLEKKWKLREIGPANVQNFHLMGLIPNTQYTFRVSARNSVGLSDFSGGIRLYTAKEDQKKEIISIRTAGPYTTGAKTNFNLIILFIVSYRNIIRLQI